MITYLNNVIQSYPINTTIAYPENISFIAYGAFYGSLHFLNVENPVSEKKHQCGH